MNRLPDFPGSQPIFQIENVPDSRDDLCKVTIVMPWAVAQQAVALAAPFLDSIRRSVDTRTRNDMEQEEREHRWRRQHQKRHQEARRALLRAIRRIPSGIDYHAFLCHCEGRESIHAWPAHSLHLLNISRRDLQRVYRRVRVNCAHRWRRRGQNVKEIAARLQCSEAVARDLLRQKKGRQAALPPRPS